jgi:hypothetical protein
MTTQHHQVITKLLVSAAIVLGAAVGLAAPAGAEENANPFSDLSCICETPGIGPVLTDHISKGIQDALRTPPRASTE